MNWLKANNQENYKYIYYKNIISLYKQSDSISNPVIDLKFCTIIPIPIPIRRLINFYYCNLNKTIQVYSV